MSTQVDLESLEHWTCPICDGQVPIIRDSRVRTCLCGIMGVDADSEGIQGTGIFPKESYQCQHNPEYMKIIKIARISWRSEKIDRSSV